MAGNDAKSTVSHESSARQIVCIYALGDESYYRKIQIYLSLWQREGYIQWLEISAGSEIEHTIQAYLQQAHLILLLISPDFFAQDRCYHAMQISLQEQARRQVAVVPVLTRASSWKESECGHLCALPDDENPIAQWASPEQAYECIRSGLVDLIPGNSDYKKMLARVASERPLKTRDSGIAIHNAAPNYGAQGVFNGPVKFDNRHSKNE